jgi:tetratricopeptide (TPR) repeat protein
VSGSSTATLATASPPSLDAWGDLARARTTIARGAERIHLEGLWGSAASLALAALLPPSRPAVVVVADEPTALRTLDDLRAFAGALGRKAPDEALEAIKPAAPYERGKAVVIYLRGLAHLEAGHTPEAIAAFQKIIDNPGWRGDGPLLHIVQPLARLGLARAAALAGDTARSRGAYQDFFALWKDADPNVPVLVQAKTEYARLR